MVDPYGILGVSRDASETEIREAYRKLARKHHPDRWISAPPALQRLALRKMTELNLAYREIGPRVSKPAELAAETPRKPPHVRREEALQRERHRRWDEAERLSHQRIKKDQEEALRREREQERQERLAREVAALRAREVAERRKRLQQITTQLQSTEVQRVVDELRNDPTGTKRGWFTRAKR